MTQPFVMAEGVGKSFDMRKGIVERVTLSAAHCVQAVSNVSLGINRGETLGLIGESGCGKSTLARVLLRLQEPSSGRIVFDGADITALSQREMVPYRKRMQIVFQDPYASLNPRRTVADIVALPLRVHEKLGKRAMRERVVHMLEQVGLAAAHLERFPHQFSGGQRQRINIARALVANPEFVVCDEAVSALDASVQAQILLLLAELRKSLGLTYLFISHNIAVVGYLSDRIAVMYLGEIVESGTARELIANPQHPYSQMLMAALPRLDGVRRHEARRDIDPPSPFDRPPGCAFAPRCTLAKDICRETAPALRMTRQGHMAACHFVPAMPEDATSSAARNRNTPVGKPESIP
jgi:oligopeptide/dipeptide ABC transporter ATP-binding protein